MIRTARIASTVMLAYLGSTAIARAQDAASAPPAASGQLGEVVVTAEKKVENAKDVPIAIGTVSGAKLEALTSAGQDLKVLNAQLPSLVAEGSYGRTYPRFYIRGYGNADFRPNASQPVSLVYDDVVQENPYLKGFPMFDLNQVEVLNGPQGSLFGRNTPAGVVKFDSVQPRIGAGYTGYVDGSIGTYDTSELQGATNVPMGDQFAGRISGVYDHRNNWIGNSVASPTDKYGYYDDGAIRAQLLYKPTDDLSVLFNVHGRAMAGTALLLRANIYQKGSNNLVPNFNVNEVSQDTPNNQRLQTWGGNVHVRWDFNGMRLTSITGVETMRFFVRQDEDGGYGSLSHPPSGPGRIPFPSESGVGVPDHDQETEEVRLESLSPGRFNWQVGAYYFHEYYEADSNTYNTFGGHALTSVTAGEQTSNSYAAFASGQYDITPKLNVRGGVRFTDDDKQLVNRIVPGLDTANGTKESRNDSRPTGDVSLDYAATSDTNLYARFASGYRGSNLQPASTTVAQTLAGPEDTLSYEAGVKSDLLDKRARVSFDGYYYTVQHLQLTEVGGGGTSNQLLSANHAIGYGVEFNADAYVTPQFLITGGLSYNHTRIDDSTLAVTGCTDGCTMLNPQNGAGKYLINGNPLPQAPDWIADVTGRYTFPLGNGSDIYLYTNWSYRSQVDFYLYKAAEFIGKPLLQGEARLGYEWGQGKYEAAVFSRNILNTVVGVSGLDFDNLAGTVNDPRLVGVEFRSRF